MRRLLPLIIILVVVGALIAYNNGLLPGGVALPGGLLQSSGALEARPVAVTAEVGGLISAINVGEGDVVTAGQVVAQIDTSLQDAQIARAQAALDTAKAQLAQVNAGARAEQVQQAQAALNQAMVARDGAAQAVTNTQAIHDTPQDIDAQIVQAQGQLQSAESAIPLAETQLRSAKVVADRYQNLTGNDDQIQYQIASAQVRAAEAGVKIATLTRDGVQATLDLLNQLRANPLALEAQVHAAQARYDQAQAQVAIAQAALDALTAGPTDPQVAIAEAQVQQAQAALDGLLAQKDKMTLRAPIAGVVTALPVAKGENVQPGTQFMLIANLDEMHFTLYVPETQIGHVLVGQKVELKVDGVPDRLFSGQVYFISPQAEFTPSTVQTADERAKTVFMVKARIVNADHTLKPGMYAQATVQPE